VARSQARTTVSNGSGASRLGTSEATDDLKLVWAGEADGPQARGAVPLAPGSGTLGRYRRIGFGLVASDAVCVAVALVASYYYRYPWPVRPMPVGETLVVVLTPLLWAAVFFTFDLYRPQHLSGHEELRRVIGASSLGIVLLVMASYWSKASFSRSWVALTWVLALVLELVVRRGWRSYLWRLRLAGRLRFRTLVVGGTPEAGRLVEILRDPRSGFTPLGYVLASPPTQSTNALPVLGEVGDLRQLIREYAVECLFVASTAVSVDDMSRIAQAARLEGIEVRVSSNLPQTLTSRLSLQTIGPAVAIALRPVSLTGRQAAMKRAFDIVAASAALLVSLPLWVVLAVAIRLTSPGPVFFHQERVTRGGRVFRMHKFRSMRTDVAVDADTTRPFFKLDADPRLTRVGAFIRRTSLDELPQFWNVLVGEMSIVGPRPLPADQVAANFELLSPRQEVPAGVTGWWQINGRSRVTPEEALRLDLFYIENWSLTLDLYILGKTFWAVARRAGAY
jgi:exopolysaccharide biosynthesis polyprenyl glycosylphosphotransferase